MIPTTILLTLSDLLSLVVDVISLIEMQRLEKSANPSDESLLFVLEEDDFAVHFSVSKCCKFQSQLVRQLINEV
jgi:hypothetical protein